MSILTAFRPHSQRLVLALGLLLLAPLGHAAASLDEASRLLKAGQPSKALDEIDDYLSSKPKDAQGRFLKGIALTALNKTGEALVVFKKLTEDYPNLPEPYNNMAVIYAQQKQYEKAKDALEMAIRTHPAYATAHENLGDIYSRLASQAYGKALQIDASNASAQTKLAMINELVGGGKVGAGNTVLAKPAAVAPQPTLVAKADAPPPAPKAQPLPPSKPAVEAKPAETKPVEAKPAEAKPPEPAKPVPAKPAAETAKPANADTEIAAAIDAWLGAWSHKDVKAYLGHYAKDFATPRGQARRAWETDRARMLSKPGRIEVSRDKLSIKSEGADKAVVHFRQNYVSSNFKSASTKTLILIRHEGRWLIQQERVGG